MTSKNKNAPQTVSHIRHFEFIAPMPLEAAVQALYVPQGGNEDYWLRLLHSQIKDAEVYSFWVEEKYGVMLEGYLKAMPDGTTFVSSSSIFRSNKVEFIHNNPPIYEIQGCLLTLFGCMGLCVLSGSIGIDYQPIVIFITLSLITVPIWVWIWNKSKKRQALAFAHYIQDALLTALQKRLAVAGEIIELDKEAMTDLPAQKAKQR